MACEHTSHSMARYNRLHWHWQGYKYRISAGRCCCCSLSPALESWTAAVAPAPARLRRSVSALTALSSPVGSRRSTYTLDSDLTTPDSDLQWHNSVTSQFLFQSVILLRGTWLSGHVYNQVLGHVYDNVWRHTETRIRTASTGSAGLLWVPLLLLLLRCSLRLWFSQLYLHLLHLKYLSLDTCQLKYFRNIFCQIIMNTKTN